MDGTVADEVTNFPSRPPDTKDDPVASNSANADSSTEFYEGASVGFGHRISMPDRPAIADTSGLGLDEDSRDTHLERNRRSGDDEDNMIWDMDLNDCECLGPPPEFLLPPPPLPPMLDAQIYCGEESIEGLEACGNEPKLDASYHSGPSFQTSAAIALCSVLLVVGILIGALIVWKHKRKMSNTCKSTSTSRSRHDTSVLTAAPAPFSLGPVYEDLPDVRLNEPLHRQDLPLEVMSSSSRAPPPFRYPTTRGRTVPTQESAPPLVDSRVFVCEPCCGDLCATPLYEELPRRPSEQSLATHSDEHFAEDELSLVGEHGPENGHQLVFRAPPPGCRTCHPRVQRNNSRQERRTARRREPEFHEGLLLDALLRFYPTVGTVGKCRPNRPLPGPMQGPPPGAWPGDVPLLGAQSWRPPRNTSMPPSQDSSFGSDSGYSNNTCGTRASSRHRLSTHSTEMGMS